METLRFIMYLFFRYYSKGGTKYIPYFSALTAVVFLIFIHAIQILFILYTFFPLKKLDSISVMYWRIVPFILPFFVIVAILVKPKDVKQLEYDEKKVKRGGTYLVIYVVTTLILLFVSMMALVLKTS